MTHVKVAATEASGTWRNDNMIKAMFDALWPGVIPTFTSTAGYPLKCNRLGDILNYAKSFLLVQNGSNSGVKGHLEIYHVIGDPTIEVWSDPPLPITVSSSIWSGLLFICLDACPAGALLTVWYRDKLIKRIRPFSRRVVIPLRDLRLRSKPLPGSLKRQLAVCFAAPGYRFTQTRVKPW